MRSHPESTMRNRWNDSPDVGIIASGPSLTQVDALIMRRSMSHVIAVNESWRMCRDADVLYAADSMWWSMNGPSAVMFRGERWTTDRGWHPLKPGSDMHVIPSIAGSDIKPDAPHIWDGMNSAFQAMSLAIKWGARKIVFIGLDMGNTGGETHWHGDHANGLANNSPYGSFMELFTIAAPMIEALGVKVINASRVTNLHCFEEMVLADAVS